MKHLTSAALHCLLAYRATGSQIPLANSVVSSGIAKLDIINRWNWMYTTQIAIGNPPTLFKAIIELARSDVLVPTVNCTEPEYCYQHPLYNSSSSSTYIPDGRPSNVSNGLYVSRGHASIDSYYVGDIEIRHQPFEEAIWLRPDYFMPESWHDSALALSREIVYDDEDSNLYASSPFQNMVKQAILEHDVFSLRLPRNMHETGYLLLGTRGDDCDEVLAKQIPLIPHQNHSRSGDSYRTSGGWEVEPVYLHFGSGEDEIYYDLRGYVAKFTTSPPLLSFPATFTDWIEKRLGADMIGRIRCADVNLTLPNITIALKGVGGRVEEFVLTAEEYATETFNLEGEESDMCQLPFEGVNEAADMPKFILLGPYFLRKFYTTFDEGSKSVFLSSLS